MGSAAVRTSVVFALAFLGVCSAAGFAQSITGSISGTVVDRTGSPIAGVTVKLTSQATAAVREALTDTSGLFQLNAIPAGFYNVTVEHPGFKKVRGFQDRTGAQRIALCGHHLPGLGRHHRIGHSEGGDGLCADYQRRALWHHHLR